MKVINKLSSMTIETNNQKEYKDILNKIQDKKHKQARINKIKKVFNNVTKG